MPDFILQTVIVRGIRMMRNDARFIDQLFRNLDQRSVAEMRKFIKEATFDLCMNYPRTTLKVPAVVILLKNEQEGQAYLGDTMGVASPDEFSYDGGIAGEVLGGTATTSVIDGNAKVVWGAGNVQAATENTIRTPGTPWRQGAYGDGTYVARIVAGTGKGQVRGVIDNGRNTLMIEGRWLTIPDTTSMVEVAQVPLPLVGEPSSLYDRRGDEAPLEKRGSLYADNYQIQVIGPNPELTIFLHTALKAIFTLMRMFMEGQGLINLKMSATDFIPRAEYVPDFAYMRALNLEFMSQFEVFESIPVAQSIRTMLYTDDFPNDDELISDTTFNIVRSAQNEPVVEDFLAEVQRVYYGVATPPGSIDANFVQDTLGTEGTDIASTRVRTINAILGDGQKLYYAYPARFGGDYSSFVDAQTNQLVGMDIVASLNLTTQFGTETYNVWASTNAGLGALQMTVR